MSDNASTCMSAAEQLSTLLQSDSLAMALEIHSKEGPMVLGLLGENDRAY